MMPWLSLSCIYIVAKCPAGEFHVAQPLPVLTPPDKILVAVIPGRAVVRAHAGQFAPPPGPSIKPKLKWDGSPAGTALVAAFAEGVDGCKTTSAASAVAGRRSAATALTLAGGASISFRS